MKSLLALATIVMLGATLHGTQQSLTVEAALADDTVEAMAIG